MALFDPDQKRSGLPPADVTLGPASHHAPTMKAAREREQTKETKNQSPEKSKSRK
jgi:hypothetical protein